MENFDPRKGFTGIMVLLSMIVLMIVGCIFFEDKWIVFGLISTIAAFVIYSIAFAVNYSKYKRSKKQ